jgi:hypothetical protein
MLVKSPLTSAAVAVAVAVVVNAAAIAPAEPIVKTTHGQVVGKVLPGSNVNAWFGIPFASPPKRFTPPEDVKPWTSNLNAKEPKPACIQQIYCKLSLLTWPGTYLAMRLIKVLEQTPKSQETLLFVSYPPTPPTPPTCVKPLPISDSLIDQNLQHPHARGERGLSVPERICASRQSPQVPSPSAVTR